MSPKQSKPDPELDWYHTFLLVFATSSLAFYLIKAVEWLFLEEESLFLKILTDTVLLCFLGSALLATYTARRLRKRGFQELITLRNRQINEFFHVYPLLAPFFMLAMLVLAFFGKKEYALLGTTCIAFGGLIWLRCRHIVRKQQRQSRQPHDTQPGTPRDPDATPGN